MSAFPKCGDDAYSCMLACHPRIEVGLAGPLRNDESSRSPRAHSPVIRAKALGDLLSPCRIGARDERYPWWYKRIQVVQFRGSALRHRTLQCGPVISRAVGFCECARSRMRL